VRVQYPEFEDSIFAYLPPLNNPKTKKRLETTTKVLVALPEHIRNSGQIIGAQKFTPNPDLRVQEQKYVTQRAEAYKMICSAQEHLKSYRNITDADYQPISAKLKGKKMYINPLGDKLSKMTTVISNKSHYEVVQALTRKDTYN
jgi:hypothetical protein